MHANVSLLSSVYACWHLTSHAGTEGDWRWQSSSVRPVPQKTFFRKRCLSLVLTGHAKSWARMSTVSTGQVAVEFILDRWGCWFVDQKFILWWWWQFYFHLFGWWLGISISGNFFHFRHHDSEYQHHICFSWALSIPFFSDVGQWELWHGKVVWHETGRQLCRLATASTGLSPSFARRCLMFI